MIRLICLSPKLQDFAANVYAPELMEALRPIAQNLRRLSIFVHHPAGVFQDPHWPELQLKELSLGGLKISIHDLQTLLTRSPKLHTLKLTYLRDAGDGGDFGRILTHPNLTSLKTLSLKSMESVTSSSTLWICTRVKELTIYGKLTSFEAFGHLTQLESVDFILDPCDCSASELVAFLRRNPNLCRLSLCIETPEWSDEDIHALFEDCPQVSEFRFRKGNKIIERQRFI
ncbi:uncharacterized protein VTP21DRAFT_4293 [Calcarisporiella thermophila]|uniref:uncharacterized protein n=1 Tax=Calcarisporiella thermophila TaxID=911321 RepID=UPI0037422222